MNPSYNSGSSASGVSNTSGVKPGMIASTSSDSAPEPMQLSGNSRGGKKGLLVVGLLIIVLLIVGVIVAVMMGGGKGGNNNSSGGTFNELINYVTSGDVSTADVNSEYDVKNSYYFLNGWNTEEEKSTIYTKTKDLMDKFVAGYKDGDSQVLNNLVKSTKEQFDFIYVIDLKNQITANAIFATGVKNSAEKTRQKMIEYYDFSGLEDNDYVIGFLKNYKIWIDTLISKINLYRENNCIIDASLSDTCMVQKNNEELNKKLNEISEAIKTAYEYVNPYYNMTRNFVANLYSVNDLLNGGSVKGYENAQE